MEGASFSSRRPAAGALPAMTLPPPTTDVPRASDGLSPSLSSVNTGSSQGSQAPGNMYSYAQQLPPAWAAPSNSSYTVSSATQAQPAIGQQHFGGRTHPIYNQGPGMHQYNHPRSSQSPATGGDGLPAPPYDQVNQPFQTSISGGGGQTTPPGLSTSQHAQGGILTSHSSIATQPPTPSSVSAHVDSYTHSRPPSTPNYYTSSATQPSSYPPYGHQPSPTQHTSSNGGPVPRGLGSMSGPHGAGMAPPASYRSYTSYQPLPTMGGSVLSNIHQPGSQMSMIQGMSVGPYGHTMLYAGQGQPQPAQSERPFKCDQCVQSFSRNHDLKRHKRIHLAVKPFPCNFCSKSFSRKDALKVSHLAVLSIRGWLHCDIRGTC
ncbi:hypothetical protein FVEG_01963 [Fusarium verticillioides 7600]|uniref:C2H2-type domain-containing protein n=1 Tax=Gibberella moniliformis (strain M3125 / FGSC 7600) TaxID=334819 RepID=W7M1W7_GIBM7|nr:hypothetical protein FVEG_01963 [Fusarium verticillioides 7600]EWG38877.1 hypothetical protein FVEG_01963 [Fusarium verticillioides 7600]